MTITTPAPSHKRRLHIVACIALAIILALAAAVRIHRLNAYGLWIDEVFTYVSATGSHLSAFVNIPENRILPNPPALTDPAHAKPWWTVLRPDAQDFHPPLYPFLLRLWVSIDGWEPASARAFSIAASLVAIAFMYAATRELSGTIPALFTAGIMAFSQAQIDFAREARSYALVLALTSWAVWITIRIEKRGATLRRLLELALACLAMLFTHYFTCTVIATLGLYAWLRFRGNTRRATLAVFAASVVIFALTWGPVIYLQMQGASQTATAGYLLDQSTNHAWMTFQRLTILPARYLFDPLPNMEWLVRFIPLAWLLALLRLNRCPDLLLWILWIPINLAPSLLMDITQHDMSLDLRRYSIQTSLGIYAMLVILSREMRPWLRYALPASALLGCVLHFSQAYTAPSRTRQKWRELAADYSNLAKGGDITVFLATPPRRDDYTDFMCLGFYVQHWPGPVLLLNRAPDPLLLQEIRHYHNILVVGSGQTAMLDALPNAKSTGMVHQVFLAQVQRLELPSVPTTSSHQ